MRVDKIQLPHFLIADLYKSSLVELDTFTGEQPTEKTTPTVVAKAAENDKISYLGENGKNVIIVVSQTDAVYLKEEELTFLTNILKACQLNLADIAIVNTAAKEVTYAAIKEQLNALKLILFDVDPSAIKLPFSVPAFQVQNYAGSTIMLAPALSALNKPTADGKLLKTKLWASLQQVFGIS
ncbi:MAG: hypothetical protein JWQ40_3862 [Segetibacter sp.]|nr:hypothetical protein [Segetibacter sp.]